MNLANQITVLRIVLVPLFVASIVYVSPERPWMRWAALGIFAGACLTDALDGWIARRWSQQTRLGSYIDPLADKLLLVSGYAMLGFWGPLPAELRLPAWVSISVIARDAIILIGAVLIFLTTGTLKAEPLLISKLTTFVQMTTLLATLAGAPRPSLIGLYYGVGILTIASGLLYIRIGERMLQPSP